MNIATVTLNPAIDRNIIYEGNLAVGSLNRVRSAVVNAGGKGINVSRMLKNLGIDTHVYGFIGGQCGKMLTDMLSEEGIISEFTETCAETRLNIKITDALSKETEINEYGGPVTKGELDLLLNTLKKTPADIVIIGGSTPYGLGDDTVRLLVSSLKLLGKTVITDVSGQSLIEAVKARPYLIKPNKAEFCQLLGYTPENDGYCDVAAKFYSDTGIEVILTLGSDGAFYAGRAGCYRLYNPKVKPKGFSGAGDTFLASFVYAVTSDMDIRNALLFASAASLAKVELCGTNLPVKDEVISNLHRIKLEEYNI